MAASLQNMPGKLPGILTKPRRATSGLGHRKYWGLAFVLPAVIFFALFSIFPVLFGGYLSLTDYDLLSEPKFTWFDNYIELIHDRLFLKAVKNTLVFVLGSTLPVWVLSLLLALLFQTAFRGREFVKALLFSPVLLHPNGVLTALVGPFLGVGEIRWLTDITLSPFAVIFVNDWSIIPFFMVIWLAGLTGVPDEVKQAARIDGANSLEVFFYIVLPLLRPTAVLVAALSTINAFQAFILQYVMTLDRGGPADANLTIGLLIWKYGFQYYRMGVAAAISVLLFIVILLVTAAQLWLGREKWPMRRKEYP
jgi:multiple sugar transport system permease protein